MIGKMIVWLYVGYNGLLMNLEGVRSWKSEFCLDFEL